MKTCSRCKIERPLSAFAGNVNKPDGLQIWCRPCHQEIYQERKRRNPNLVNDIRKHALRRYYGITEDQYDELLVRQNGVCAICKEPPGIRRLAVDHCHETKAVRGLLCDRCNTTLGKFNDNIELFQSAIDYLSQVFLSRRSS